MISFRRRSPVELSGRKSHRLSPTKASNDAARGQRRDVPVAPVDRRLSP